MNELPKAAEERSMMRPLWERRSSSLGKRQSLLFQDRYLKTAEALVHVDSGEQLGVDLE